MKPSFLIGSMRILNFPKQHLCLKVFVSFLTVSNYEILLFMLAFRTENPLMKAIYMVCLMGLFGEELSRKKNEELNDDFELIS